MTKQAVPSQQLVHFRWLVPHEGYRWIQAKGPGNRAKGPWLVKNAPPGDTPNNARTEPLLDDPGLFLTFAELGSTEEEILRFTSLHGWLGIREEITVERGSLAEGEPLSKWVRAIADMRSACELLEAIQGKDLKSLRKWIEEEEIDGPFSNHSVAFQRKFPDIGVKLWFRIIGREPDSALLRKGDFLRAGRVLMQRIANDQLDAHTSARVLMDEEKGQQGLYVNPANLLGALWVQFSESIDGGRTKRRCEQCRAWMLLAPDTSRSDRAYCSDSCRVSAYRDRKKSASRLRRKGMTPSAIAKKLGSDTETVRGWLAQSKKGK